MQRLKVCRKLMAFVLTLCMVLPLISNQYLVVRAEETGDTAVTKKLSDLVQEHKYVTVDMTQGKDVALNDQQWTESAYTYVTSNREASEKQTETVQGALYQLKVKKGQTIGVIGGTGCGKSTLVNLIPRFYEATEGSVFVDKVNV